MNKLNTIGRLLYSIGMIALGAQQVVFKIFRQEIITPLPAWPHQYAVLPVLIGLALIFSGIIISGLVKIKSFSPKNVCLYLAGFFLFVALFSQLPYILFFSPHPALRLDVWFGFGQALAYCGGALVVARSFSGNGFSEDRKTTLLIWLEKLIPVGGVFFSIIMLMFGASHFVFADFVSTMVPKYVGMPMFWTYFCGVALVGAGISIVFKIWVKPIALLLALMLFIFFLSFHIPDVIANPTVNHSNEVVRAFVALIDCGTALVIATNSAK